MLKWVSGIFGKSLGMDLGTANSLIYAPRKGIVLNEPSVVAIDHDDRILAVGHQARRCVGRTPKGIRLVRPMKNGVIADFEAAERMISHFINQATSGSRLFKPRMVIGVPNGITAIERRAVIDSALLGGMREVLLIDEAVAAAVGAGLPIMDAQGSMVVDIGGGTSDIAVMCLSAVVCGESARVAGDVMDEAIQNFLKEEFRFLVGEVVKRPEDDERIQWISSDEFKACR